ncbi:MAG TPA: hypothetical protein VNW04_23570 [Puia sp.]|jgi:hypothetical protein|nr:hypothetical protein [Puia sp.]
MKITGNKFTWFILLAMILPGSCSPGKVSRKKLISIIEHDPGLNQTREINGIKVQARYCPYQLLVCQELLAGNNRDSARVSVLEKKYSGQYYFRLYFSKNDKEVIRQLGSYDQYSNMLQVFAFRLGTYINTTTEKNDTLPLRDYAFEQGYGMSNANTTLLVFKKSDFDNAGVINLNIGEFGLGIGNVRFTFRQQDLKGIPSLSYRQLD